MYKNYLHVGLLLMLIASDLLAAEDIVQFAPLMAFRGNWSGSDTYMSASEAASDYMSQFEKTNSQYASCLATLDARKPAGCSRVDLGGVSADSSVTYNGRPWRYLINVTSTHIYMDGYGRSDTSVSSLTAVANRIVMCPVESYLTFDKAIGTDTHYWCKRTIPLVKKNNICAGNPINIANGKKQQWETDYSSADGLVINRFYAGQLAGWQIMPLPRLGEGGGEDCQILDYFKYPAVEDKSEVNFSLRKLSEVTKSVCVQGAIKSADVVLTTADGIPLEFRKDAADNYYSTQTPARLFRLLADFVDGIKWRVIHPDGTIWEFDHQGNLRLGVTGDRRIEYTYVNKTLTKMVSLSSGKEVRFEYTDGLISKAVTPEGPISYLFGKTGAILAPGMLRSVITVDGSEQQYFYEDTRFSLAMTGAGIAGKPRYATWKYDGSGYAIESSHADGKEKFTFDYTNLFSEPSKVTVTNPLMKKTTYEFTTIAGRRELIKVTGEPTVNCLGANQAYQYYPNGQLEYHTDWKGNKTYFTYDVKGRELTRTQAFGTEDASTVQTCWHETLNQPSRIIEPTRVTLIDYFPGGKIKSQTVKPRPAGAVDCSTAL